MTAERVPAIGTTGVVTRDRAASLERCLAGYIENGRRFGRSGGFVIADGSSRRDSRDRCLRTALRLKAKFGAAIAYAGAREKRLYVDALAAEGVPRRVAAFALFGPGGEAFAAGANRNALLLHAAGELFFSSDDDVHCRVAVPSRGRGLAFESAANPEEYRFFKSRAAALEAADFRERDVLGLHERFLGKSLRGLAAGPEPPGNAKILATVSGLVGDCALASPRSYLRLRGPSRARLTGSRADYRAALSRQVLRAVPRATVSAAVSFTTSAAGYDNRELLPPFMPAFRNEDGAFGVMLRKCFADGRFAHLPEALLHAPPEARAFASDDYWKIGGGVRVNDLLHQCLLLFEPKGGGAEGNLRALGGFLVGLGSSASREFETLARTQVRRARGLQLLHLERLLDEYRGFPGFWAADVRKYAVSLEKSLACSADLFPLETSRGRGTAGSWREFQRLVLEFGRLSECWPELVRAAKKLREDGVRVARPVEP